MKYSLENVLILPSTQAANMTRPVIQQQPGLASCLRVTIPRNTDFRSSSGSASGSVNRLICRYLSSSKYINNDSTDSHKDDNNKNNKNVKRRGMAHLTQTSDYQLAGFMDRVLQQQQQQQQAPRYQDSEYTNPDFYKLSTLPPHLATTLNPKSYRDSEFFRLEQERVFGKTWTCVGTLDQLRRPGDTIVAKLAGKPIFVTRDKHGNLNGFMNVCRHRGSRLVNKNGRYPVISCPYHRWGYSLDGRLVATPMWNTVQGGATVDIKTGEIKPPKESKSSCQKSSCADTNALTRLVQRGKVASTSAMKDAVNEVARAEEDAENSANRIWAALGSVSYGETQANSNINVNSDASSSFNDDAICKQMKSIMQAYDTGHIENFDKKHFSLFKCRVDVHGGLVYATFSKEGEIPTLKEQLGGIVEEVKDYPLHELVTVRSKVYKSNCNWKLLMENFMEYYHLPAVHPALCAISGVNDHNRNQLYGKYTGFNTFPLTSGAGTPIDTDVLGPVFPGVKGDQANMAVFHAQFPNVFYFLMPNHLFVVHIEPISPTETLEHSYLMIHPSLYTEYEAKEKLTELNEKLDKMMKFYDMTNLEDIQACEWVQEGVSCDDYKGGRVSYRFEETIHRFQNIYIDHLCGFYKRVPLGDDSIPFYLGGQPDDLAHKLIRQDTKCV